MSSRVQSSFSLMIPPYLSLLYFLHILFWITSFKSKLHPLGLGRNGGASCFLVRKVSHITSAHIFFFLNLVMLLPEKLGIIVSS